MADEYTPTTTEVRRDYARAGDPLDADYRSVGHAAFDRWLAAHDRATAARAWDEGERHESHTLTTFGQFCPHGTRCNPYREEDRRG